jgi:hypothetical protein
MNRFTRLLDMASTVSRENNFGLVVPERYARRHHGEEFEQHTEILLERGETAQLDVLLRFLQLEVRTVEAYSRGKFRPVEALADDGERFLTADERIERDVALRLDLSHEQERTWPIVVPGGNESRLIRDPAGALRGRVTSERSPIFGLLSVSATSTTARADVQRVVLHLENRSLCAGDERELMMRTAMICAHTLVASSTGTFLSAIDPPEYVAAASKELRNRNVWPVLAAAREDDRRAQIVLSSPVILCDFPGIEEEQYALS